MALLTLELDHEDVKYLMYGTQLQNLLNKMNETCLNDKITVFIHVQGPHNRGSYQMKIPSNVLKKTSGKA